ncbi:arylamine N-acetyltransferase [candidate division KSB1 bacterium]|nr:arylamine N-acetyltransferase [candidate division KSB1 bacterium]
MSDQTPILKFDPHPEAVSAFRKHFSISREKPDIELLKEILSHYSQIPYENLSKIIKHHQFDDVSEKIRLPEEVMEDHARFHLGGTCFALTFFLEAILKQHGYNCYPVMADMRYGPNTHCAMVVILNGIKYLVDPGYLLNQPMELVQNRPRIYDTEFSGVELVYQITTSLYEIYTFRKDEIKWRYQFRDIPVAPKDFARLWTSSFAWNGMHGLCLSRTEKGRMVYVHKTFMRETSYDKKTNYNIKKDYHLRIHETFGIAPERVEEALAALEANLERERELGLWVPKKSGTVNGEREKIKRRM